MKTLYALLLMSCALTAVAQPVASTLLSVRAPLPAQARAATMTIEVLVLNADSQSVNYTPPQELVGTLQIEQRSWPVTLHPAQAAAALTINAGQFVSIPYVLTLPDDAVGQAVLEITQVPALRMVLDINDTPSASDGAAASMIATLKQEEAAGPPAMAHIERTFANRFAFHEPIYFLYGNKAPVAKFQFSFKYRLLGEDSKFGELIPPFRGFYFAYTQRSLWDISAASSPFYDTSYMPELFFEWLAPTDKKTDGWFHWLGLQTGARHESNGKAGTDSRTSNIAYLRGGVTLGPLNGWHWVLLPRIFTYVGSLDGNEDIARYRGHSELQMSFGKSDSLQVGIITRIGSHANKGSVQVDLTQPIRIPVINLETYLQLQYFDGYGESLRTYNQKSSEWRLGFAFVR